MNPTPEQIVQALPHVRYEIESLLQTPAFDAANKALQESAYFRKMAHCRALYTFFTRSAVKRQKLDPNDDDVVSEDFAFQAEPLYSGDPKPLLDRFNKRLFHITYSRINERGEWMMDKLLSPVMFQSRKFIDHILQISTIRLDDAERDRWRSLKAADVKRLPLQQNTLNVATYQTQIIEFGHDI